MENTLENKTKFFAQYWGQGVYKTEENRNFPAFIIGSATILNPKAYLELKPISSITDEDALECTGKDLFITYQSDEESGCYGMSPSGIFLDQEDFYETDRYTADYLRSKGYALPWMGLSVEDLVNFGWIKLKEN